MLCPFEWMTVYLIQSTQAEIKQGKSNYTLLFNKNVVFPVQISRRAESESRYVWTSKLDLNTTCGREIFWIRKETVADSKIGSLRNDDGDGYENVT